MNEKQIIIFMRNYKRANNIAKRECNGTEFWELGDKQKEKILKLVPI